MLEPSLLAQIFGNTTDRHPWGARWLSGRASDSGARGLGFETYFLRVVSLSKTLYSPKVLVIPRKLWLSTDMTEKLLTGTLSFNTNKRLTQWKSRTMENLQPMPLRKYAYAIIAICTDFKMIIFR